MASLGAKFYDSSQFTNISSDEWAWTDGYNTMKSSSDYSNCATTTPQGICQGSSGNECLIADASNGDYNWKSFPCKDAHINFMCEYDCDPESSVEPGTWPPQPPHPPCWWCSDIPGKMQQMVGFVGNTSSDPNIYVQEQNMTVHALSLPKK